MSKRDSAALTALLTNLSETAVNGTWAQSKLVEQQLGCNSANGSPRSKARVARLKPLDIHAQMDAIREVAAEHGLAALEGLADRSAQLALLPGHRMSRSRCLEHMDEALLSDRSTDRKSILAALAIRLH